MSRGRALPGTSAIGMPSVTRGLRSRTLIIAKCCSDALGMLQKNSCCFPVGPRQAAKLILQKNTIIVLKRGNDGEGIAELCT